jgi:hypothetical protein
VRDAGQVHSMAVCEQNRSSALRRRRPYGGAVATPESRPFRCVNCGRGMPRHSILLARGGQDRLPRSAQTTDCSLERRLLATVYARRNRRDDFRGRTLASPSGRGVADEGGGDKILSGIVFARLSDILGSSRFGSVFAQALPAAPPAQT